MSANLLAFGRRGATRPLLLLYAPEFQGPRITAPAYSTLYPVTARSETLREMERHGEGWRVKRGGMRVRLPCCEAGHRLHQGLTLTNTRKAKAI
ncbi:hypothetical protein [Deinococcus sp. NW-56]|uniref:hypothetical protein n=1 Tax=Deinococcus sp. NW-56 TaxID=2080419 RepID=UPI001319F4DA|nr:hypothetical protein [Deinococcus sp. NW-56]